MWTKPRRLLAGAFLTAGLSLGIAAPVSAQPVVTGGLVNVTVTNLLNNNTVNVQLPINAAANICNVQVPVISNVVNAGGTYTCTARSGNQSLSITKA
jgi:hypothetical protein